jgi:uncharacterized C2H2 Zn-finger protein
MPVADAKRPENSLIVEGRYMRCPRCKKTHDILRYVPMGQIEEFQTETVPVYKCPSCRWIFAPVLDSLKEIFERGDELG